LDARGRRVAAVQPRGRRERKVEEQQEREQHCLSSKETRARPAARLLYSSVTFYTTDMRVVWVKPNGTLP
jgi:hypothetical protein